MKIKNLHKYNKLNQSGFDHVLVAVLCVVAVGIVGTAMLVASHAYTVHWKGLLEEGSGSSGFCLTTNGSANGSSVALDPCNSTGSNTQSWSLNYTGHATVLGTANVQEFTLQSANGTTECLNDPYGSKTNGVALQVYSCHSSDPNNLWVWGGSITGKGLAYHQLINVATAGSNAPLCIDDAYGSHAAANKVQLWACKTSGQANQSWYEASSSGGSANATPPAPPTNLQAFTGGNNIALVWDMPTAPVKDIQVYRNGTQIATVTPSANVAIQNVQLGKEYDDNAVTAGSTYQYKVRAEMSDGTTSAFTPTVSATQPTNSQPVPNITVNTSGASTAVANYMTTYIVPLLKTWYPKVADEIAYPTYTAPKSYTINFSTSVGTAGDVCYTATSNGTATISCDPNWMAANIGNSDNGAAAVFVHESTHVIQDGFPNDTTGFATEGGASWASDFFARQNINLYTPYLDNPKETGPSSYTPGAFFINFIRDNYDANFPKQLNTALHNNTYTSSLVSNSTGGLSISQVWQKAISDYNGSVGAVTGVGGKCIEVQNGTVADGTKIVLDTCNGSKQQQWALHYHTTNKTGEFELTSPTLGNATGTDYCIDDSYSGTTDGTGMQYWGCDQTKAQFWTFGANGTIVNENSGTCLSTLNASSANGAQLVISTCNGGADQKWTTPS